MEVPGMTLRDWFAGQALTGIADTHLLYGDANVAAAAYNLADAMMKESEDWKEAEELIC